MQPFATLGNELGDGRVRRGGLEQFEAALSDGNHHQLHLFMFDRLFGRDAEP